MTELPLPRLATEVLGAVIAGEAQRIDELRLLPQTEIIYAARELGGELQVGRQVLLGVLMSWRSGLFTDRQVRSWARFLFIGAFPEELPSGDWRAHYTHETEPLHIEYSDDSLVNEVVFRLTEIGDEIDGVISPGERDEMVTMLGGLP